MKNKTKHLFFIIFFLFSVQKITFSQNGEETLKNLVIKAEVVLTGKVIMKNSIWGINKSKIYTDVTIEISDLIKGSETNKTITVRYLGGEVDGVGEQYTHMPKFKMEEEVLLFANKDTDNQRYKVLNGENGKVTLFRNKSTGNLVSPQNVEITKIKEAIKTYLTE